ncbi:hypothetical protein [Microseira wollei]|uniref:hypothetical protein n=1 Tax=Microseira wollei TaxID=467598 RepID=UPI001CFC8078|nr:hypothetical protein [Microseira wollei]
MSYIETQRYGEEAILGGLIKNDPEAIAAGFKMFNKLPMVVLKEQVASIALLFL